MTRVGRMGILVDADLSMCLIFSGPLRGRTRN